jgi:cytochrome oxidase Cu insertion factor (SCO1/SenC/PrrC family)
MLRIAVVGAVLALGAGWGLPAAAQTGAQPATPTVSAGKAAPDFLLYDQDGKPFRLSAQRGHKVLIDFYRGYY